MRYAVVVTHQRHMMMTRLAHVLKEQSVHVVVVDNNMVNWSPYQGPSDTHLYYGKFDEDFRYPEAVNVGLDWVYRNCEPGSTVAVFNDDVMVGREFYDEMVAAIKYTHAALAFPDHSGRYLHGALDFNDTPGTIFDHGTKVCGYGYVLDCDKKLRHDERFKIYYSDNAIQEEAK